MLYKTKIYVSDVTNLSDARYAAGMLVDYIGFPVDSSMEHHLDIHTFNAITGWLQGINIVAEFNDASTETINNFIKENSITIVSIPAERISEASEIKGEVIVRNLTKNNSVLPNNVIFATSEEDLAVPYFKENISEENLNKSIENTHLQGVILKGSEEERPGYKDYDEIATIIELLEV